jgi:hypothetical protein
MVLYQLLIHLVDFGTIVELPPVFAVLLQCSCHLALYYFVL